MGIFDQAKDKVGQLASEHPDTVEQLSDQALDRASQAADQATGGRFGEHIQKGRDLADERVGHDQHNAAEHQADTMDSEGAAEQPGNPA